MKYSILLLLVLIFGCSTYKKPYTIISKSYGAGQYGNLYEYIYVTGDLKNTNTFYEVTDKYEIGDTIK